MVIEQIFETGNARRNVWCKLNELIDNGDNTYSFNENFETNSLGFGSKIIVIDNDMILFYDNILNVLYPWAIRKEEDYED